MARCASYTILTLGLNLVTGYMGQMSFRAGSFLGHRLVHGSHRDCQAGFSTIPAMLAMVVSGFFGFLVSLPTLKLRGYYLTIVTMGFCEIIRLIELNSTFTGGAFGISRIPAFSFFGLAPGQREIYLVALVLVVLVTLAVKILFPLPTACPSAPFATMMTLPSSWASISSASAHDIRHFCHDCRSGWRV
ncbi:MAG: ABC transporter permease subunit [Christensenellales bacterium]